MIDNYFEHTEIRTMTSVNVSSAFRCSLLFLALFVMSQTLAKPANGANGTPVKSAATKLCSKNIETILQEMKKQLINILKMNKTFVKEFCNGTRK